MRLHAGLTAPGSATRCRALVGGFGVPGMRDLDFGRQFVRYAEALRWPDDVVVEDLSFAAHLALHRLQELAPATVVLVGSVARGTAEPGEVRRYRLDLPPPGPSDVHVSLTESLNGAQEFHHTLRVLRHWGALPPDTVVIEVEPADTSFGLGFSEKVGSSLEHIAGMVRTELGCAADSSAGSELSVEGVLSDATEERHTAGDLVTISRHGGPGVTDLLEYARLHRDVRDAVASVRDTLLPEAPNIAGLSVAVSARPFGTGLHTKGDWYDFVPLPDPWVGIALGDVADRGIRAAIAMSQLRTAVRATARTHGLRPGEVIDAVDRVVRETGLGTATTLIYLALNVASGELRLANAGHCPPVLALAGGGPALLELALSAPLGMGPDETDARPEASVRLAPDSTVFVYTDGLLAGARGRGGGGSERLAVALATGPRELNALRDHVMSHCLAGVRRDDDASLIVLRLAGTEGGEAARRGP